MKKKYLILEGEITSQYDGDIHFISAERLIDLYGVDRSECVIVRLGQTVRGICTNGLTILSPRYDGDYSQNYGK